MALQVARTVDELRKLVAKARTAGDRIGLVPTMGALHHGHMSLIDHIATQAETIVVSIFVNPTQFGEGEDFDAYPRTFEDDLKKIETSKASVVFMPKVEEMYPEGDATTVSVSGISERFEGEARPGHFAGVATVVSKLLMQCMPDVAIFGEKDYQQLAVIRRFVKDLSIPVEIMGAPIAREADGLAASSRNVYLSQPQRAIAGELNGVLRDLVENVENGDDIDAQKSTAADRLLTAGLDGVDYVEVVCAESLEPIQRLDRAARVLAVARLGNVRLLDNMAISPQRNR